MLMKSANKFRRVKITEKDVIKPFAILMTANVVVLAAWTAVSPLQFQRVDDFFDEYGRVASSHGSCVASSGNNTDAIPFLVVLAAINLCPVIFANVQAYKARNIHTEYSESRFIAMVNGSLLQAWFTGIPLLVMVRDNPSAFFVVATIILFLTSLAILLLIFVPKIDYLRVQNRDDTTKTSPAGRKSDAENGLRTKVFRGSAAGKAFSDLSSRERDSFRKSNSEMGLRTKEFGGNSTFGKSFMSDADASNNGLQAVISEIQQLDDDSDEEEETEVANDGLRLHMEKSPVGENGIIQEEANAS